MEGWVKNPQNSANVFHGYLLPQKIVKNCKNPQKITKNTKTRIVERKSKELYAWENLRSTFALRAYSSRILRKIKSIVNN